MIKVLCSIFCSLIFTGLSALDATNFPSVRELNPKDIKSSGDFGFFYFDDICFEDIDNLYGHFRIYSSNGKELPFKVEQLFKQQGAHISKQITLKSQIIDFKLDENQAQIIVENKTEQPIAPTSFTIETPNVDFDKKVSIYGSQDAQKFSLIAANLPFFDYSGKIKLSKKNFDIPASKYRFFKFVITNFSEASPGNSTQIEADAADNILKKNYVLQNVPLKINNIKLHEMQVDFEEYNLIPQSRRVKLTKITDKLDAKKQQSIYYFSSNRESIISLNLKSSSHNFRRKVTVEGQSAGGDYVKLAETTISNFKFRQHSENNTTITCSGRFPNYRLTIFNEDNPALNNVELFADVKLYRGIFLLPETPDEKILFYFGSSEKLPKYDIDVLLDNRKTQHADFKEYIFSDKIVNSDYNPRSMFRTYKWIFPLSVLAAMAILAFLLIRSFKIPPEKLD